MDETKKINLINFLDNEINHLRSRNKENGWTSWGLMGAIAAIIGSFLGQFDMVFRPLNSAYKLRGEKDAGRVYCQSSEK